MNLLKLMIFISSRRLSSLSPKKRRGVRMAGKQWVGWFLSPHQPDAGSHCEGASSDRVEPTTVSREGLPGLPDSAPSRALLLNRSCRSIEQVPELTQKFRHTVNANTLAWRGSEGAGGRGDES